MKWEEHEREQAAARLRLSQGQGVKGMSKSTDLNGGNEISSLGGTQREKAVPVILRLGLGRILTRIFDHEASRTVRPRPLAPKPACRTITTPEPRGASVTG